MPSSPSPAFFIPFLLGAFVSAGRVPLCGMRACVCGGCSVEESSDKDRIRRYPCAYCKRVLSLPECSLSNWITYVHSAFLWRGGSCYFYHPVVL